MSDLLKDAWHEMGYSHGFTRTKFVDRAIRSLCEVFNDPVTIKRRRRDTETLWVVMGDGFWICEDGLAEALAKAVLRFKIIREAVNG